MRSDDELQHEFHDLVGPGEENLNLPALRGFDDVLRQLDAVEFDIRPLGLRDDPLRDDGGISGNLLRLLTRAPADDRLYPAANQALASLEPRSSLPPTMPMTDLT